MTWQITGKAVDVATVGHLEPIEILYELDTPKIFTAELGGALVLVYESAVDLEQKFLRLIAAPTDMQVLDALKNGNKSVFQALDQPWVWGINQGFDGIIQSASLLTGGMAAVPEGYKPGVSAMLWPHLTPLVSARLIGAGLKEGHIPASVIKRAAESIPAALKKLFDMASGANKQGRPDDSTRNLYDLEAQQLAFNSFEIAFRPARQAELSQKEDGFAPYLEQGAILATALQWATEASDAKTTMPEIIVLEALEKLVPPMHGVVECVELRGRIFEQQLPFTLSRATAKKVKTQLTAYRALALPRTLVSVDGVIDALDKGLSTLILRGTPDGESVSFVFSEEYLDDVFLAFSQGIKVKISGRGQQNKQPLEMVGLEPLESLL